MQLKQNQVLNSSTSLAMVPWHVLPVIIAGIAIGIFILDTFTHPEILVAMLYVGVVLLSARFLPKRGVILVSLGCMALAVLSYFLVQHGASPAAALANRLLSLAAIGITAFFAVQSRSREMVLSEQAGLLDLSHDTIFVRDMTDVITYWNSGAEELYGWKKEEAIGKVTHQLMQTIFPEPLEEITAVLLRTGRWEGELVHTKKDGTQATVASRWSVQLDALGNPAAILETNNDITERKRAEEAARRSEEELRQVIETVPAMVWTALPDGNVDFMSQRWQEFTDLSPEESLGWDWGAAVHPEDREQHESKWRASLATGQTFSAEMRLCRPTDGEYRWFLDSAVPLRDEHGNILKWYGFVVDIDDRKRAEEALQKVQAELAHVARVTTMGALTSSIAHEVNQPLGAIVTNANAALRWLAGQPPNIDEARETLGRIVRDGHRAGEVIGRVRALLKKTATVRARVDLNGLIEDAAALLQGELRRHRILLRTGLAHDLPPVAGDRVQLQQVILNLMMNGIEAMKAVTDRPRELLIASRPEASGAVLVAVKDVGIGLDPQGAERVFEPFYTTKAEGLGMGLAICRLIIEVHGGRLWASANEPCGAVFQFTLPSTQNETAPAEPAGAMPTV